MRSPLKLKFWRSPLIPKVSVRSPLKLKFWRSPLVPTSFSAIAPQIEILAIAPHPTSFSAIAPQIEVLAIAPRSHKFQCDRPSHWVYCNWRSHFMGHVGCVAMHFIGLAIPLIVLEVHSTKPQQFTLLRNLSKQIERYSRN